MDNPLPKFVYDALPPQHIRILHLSIASNSADKAGSLSCSLQTIPFLNDENHTPFEALSYAWGSLAETYPLICDGKELRIHHNLHEALPCLARRSSKDLPLWIDAVCINQADEKEKAQQIRLMSKVFSGAERVWVWLGPAVEPDAQMAIDEIIPQMGPASARLKGLSGFKTLSPKELDLPGIESPAWDAFNGIVNSPWSSRLWVIQEACLAKEIFFMYGSHELDIDTLTVAKKCLSECRRIRDEGGQYLRHEFRTKVWPFENREAYQRMQRLQRAKDLSRAAIADNFGVTILVSVRSECSDPKDRVLGVLGLLEGDTINEIQFNEESSIVDLYTQLMKFLLLNISEYLLWNLLLCLAAGRQKNHARLPSWCPDLHACKDVRLPTSSWNRDFQASPHGRLVHFDHSLMEMNIHSIVVDTLNVIGPKFPAISGSDTIFCSEFAIWETSVRELFFSDQLEMENLEPNGNGFTYHDYWQTLFAENVSLNGSTNRSFESFAELIAWARDMCAFMTAGFYRRIMNHNLIKRDSVVINEKETSFAELLDRIRQDDIQASLVKISATQSDCTIFSTINHRFGFSSGEIRTGDQVIIFNGATYPYLIRRCPGDKETYRLVGVVYLRGMMRGEVEQLGLESREIVLV